MSRYSRLRQRAMHARTAVERAFWMRAFLREKARRGEWDDRMLNGHPGDVTLAVKKFIMRGVAAGLICTSTRDGQHAQQSYHYTEPGRAADMGLRRFTPRSLHKRRLFQLAEAQHADRYDELYGPDNRANVRNGARVALVEGSALETLHDTHVHGAPRF